MSVPKIRRLSLLSTVVCSISICGCAGQADGLAGQYVPQRNDVLEEYGFTLDENSSPEQTAWALLQGIRDEFRTRRGSAEWHESVTLQCRLANVELWRDLLEGKITGSRNRPVELIFEIVSGWAAALQYYAPRFDGDFESAQARMTSRNGKDTLLPAGQQEVRIVDYLPPTPSEGATATVQGISIRIVLAKTAKDYWRVYKIILGPSPAAIGS